MPTKPVDKEEDTASPALPAYQLPVREMDVRIRNAPQGLDGFGQRARYSVHVCVGAYLLSVASGADGTWSERDGVGVNDSPCLT